MPPTWAIEPKAQANQILFRYRLYCIIIFYACPLLIFTGVGTQIKLLRKEEVNQQQQ